MPHRTSVSKDHHGSKFGSSNLPHPLTRDLGSHSGRISSHMAVSLYSTHYPPVLKLFVNQRRKVNDLDRIQTGAAGSLDCAHEVTMRTACPSSWKHVLSSFYGSLPSRMTRFERPLHSVEARHPPCWIARTHQTHEAYPGAKTPVQLDVTLCDPLLCRLLRNSRTF